MVVQEIFTYLLELDTLFLLALLVIGLIILLKVIGFVLKLFLVGLIFAAFPFVANMVGIPVPLTLNSIILSALFGIIIYFIFSAISIANKVLNFILAPFKALFGGKKKVVVKEVPAEKKETDEGEKNEEKDKKAE